MIASQSSLRSPLFQSKSVLYLAVIAYTKFAGLDSLGVGFSAQKENNTERPLKQGEGWKYFLIMFHISLSFALGKENKETGADFLCKQRRPSCSFKHSPLRFVRRWEEPSKCHKAVSSAESKQASVEGQLH